MMVRVSSLPTWTALLYLLFVIVVPITASWPDKDEIVIGVDLGTTEM